MPQHKFCHPVEKGRNKYEYIGNKGPWAEAMGHTGAEGGLSQVLVAV